MAAAAREVAQVLKTEPAQVEGDLVVSGRYGRNPATVRFSSNPEKPPLLIQLEVPLLPWLNAGSFTSGQPAYFTFTVVPRESVVKERGTIMSTGNQMLDSRFLIRCDNPAGAKPFVQDKQAQTELQKLCCSPKTSLRIQGVNMELIEMGGAQNGRHILAHLESMGKLAGAAPATAARPVKRGTTGSFQLPAAVTRLTTTLGIPAGAKLPGVKMPKVLGERGPVILAAGTVLLIVALVAWNMLMVKEEEPTGPPAGVAAADVALIPDVSHWALMTDKDFDPVALAWQRGKGGAPAARFTGDFVGSGAAADVVYVLKRRGGMMRVVLLSGGKSKYDTNFSPLAVVARVPKSALDGVQWTDMPASTPDGDGLLIVRKGNDPLAAVVVMLIKGKVITAHPANYQDLHLQ
ncbi:MAG TPA: hypothetical protein VGQ94_07675 [Terriglobales bacterium]|nr:hypothetical protein [Terriglobales bacterium]